MVRRLLRAGHRGWGERCCPVPSGWGDLTDEQWAVLKPLLPKGATSGRPPLWPRRQLIDGIRFRARTGVPSRDVLV
ncbi:transposase [Streptomyces sp. NPDC085479]|uniref:transposase n=1 Tax=Streptomyces sp. NPDC085479 TaxID=3365726 RepID=UPI0037D721D6